MFDDFNQASAPLYDPRTTRVEQKTYIPLDLVPQIAKRTITNFSLDTFNTLYQTVIDQGMTTEQEIGKQFGKDMLRLLQSPKTNPSPAKCQDLLKFFSGLDPEAATGRKERYRHANPRPREERSAQPL